MDQEKFGKFIKEIRKKNNLTQKQLADKYNVTYQAVSKWENGKNMPDTSLIKQMSNDFGITLEEMFDGEFKESKKGINNKKNLFIIIALIIVIIISVIIIINSDNNNFEFKTLSSNCENFNISGSIAYNDNKTSIYISDIKYCGGDDKELYKEIECVLYESSRDIDKKISSYKYNENKNISLEEFLQTVTFSIDNYSKVCKDFSENSLFLSINAKDNDGRVTTYKVPLSLNQNCPA